MQGTIYKPATDGKLNTYLYGDAQTFPDIDTVVASHGDWFAFKGDRLYISGDIAINSAPGPRNLILGAIGDVTFTSYPEYDVLTDGSWTLPNSVDALLISSQHGSITMDSSFTLYGSGLPQAVSFYAYGPTSDVKIAGPYNGNLFGAAQFGGGDFQTIGGPQFANIDLPYGSFQAYAENDVTLTTGAVVNASEVALTAGRDVDVNRSTIRAKTSLRINALGNIKIQNSSQLVALSGVNPLSILLKAEGTNGTNGNIDIINSSMDAAGVEMVSARGNISISNDYPDTYRIAADVIKARVMSTGGELHITNGTLGRSIPPAASLIKLYGEGASGVRFSGTNTLSANSVDIAGQTVTIDANGTVKLHNPSGSRVWTDFPNFNNGSHGNFTDSTSSIQHNPHAGGFGAKPPY